MFQMFRLNHSRGLAVSRFLNNAGLKFEHGHPVLTVMLPSRREPVMFTIRPVTGTVGSLVKDIIDTDGGVYKAEILSEVSKIFIDIFKEILRIVTLKIICLIQHFSGWCKIFQGMV